MSPTVIDRRGVERTRIVRALGFLVNRHSVVRSMLAALLCGSLAASSAAQQTEGSPPVRDTRQESGAAVPGPLAPPAGNSAPQSPEGAPASRGVIGAQAAPSPTQYVIGSQDVLNITVWDQSDLSGKFTVEADGTFTFPLIGRVTAGGLTLRALETELKKRLRDGYFKDPQLSVGVDQYRSRRIYVIGEVRQPGTYALTGDMTLIEAIARAGSTSERAGRYATVVRSPGDASSTGPVMPTDTNGSETIRIDLKELQSGRATQDFALRDGDTIYVSPAEPAYITGQVRNPGAYTVPTGMTVLQALSLAGGVTDRGTTSRLKILRIVNGNKVEIKAKLTELVQPGDTVIVPERYF